jgi:hypothetical protein
MLTMRAVYGLGAAYLLYALPQLFIHLAGSSEPERERSEQHARFDLRSDLDGSDWFAETKPFCNSLEAATRIRNRPPPPTNEGRGYAAACMALAGKLPEARRFIDLLDERGRVEAASIVFNIGHPIADDGDDASAGPLMRLVLDYWPTNYQAMYHAGMAEYALGDLELARSHLRTFLQIYSHEDGFRRSAKQALVSMSDQSPYATEL